jgi:hypothetical protein
MSKWQKVSAVVLTGLAMACASMPATVPVAGPPAALQQLSGEWFGEYSGGPGGREGGLFFKLAAGDELAEGEVWMRVRGEVRPPYQINTPAVQPIAIQFVWIDESFVSGTLDLYRDPDTDCILLTTFRGRLEKDFIKGTFMTENKTTGQMTSGSWSAMRVTPAAVDEP